MVFRANLRMLIGQVGLTLSEISAAAEFSSADHLWLKRAAANGLSRLNQSTSLRLVRLLTVFKRTIRALDEQSLEGLWSPLYVPALIVRQEKLLRRARRKSNVAASSRESSSLPRTRSLPSSLDQSLGHGLLRDLVSMLGLRIETQEMMEWILIQSADRGGAAEFDAACRELRLRFTSDSV